LADARSKGDVEVEVLALDALARRAIERDDLSAGLRLLHSADDLSAGIGHVLSDLDRIDAHLARMRISGGFEQPDAH
jgi:hypothetical protein